MSETLSKVGLRVEHMLAQNDVDVQLQSEVQPVDEHNEFYQNDRSSRHQMSIPSFFCQFTSSAS